MNKIYLFTIIILSIILLNKCSINLSCKRKVKQPKSRKKIKELFPLHPSDPRRSQIKDPRYPYGYPKNYIPVPPPYLPKQSQTKQQFQDIIKNTNCSEDYKIIDDLINELKIKIEKHIKKNNTVCRRAYNTLHGLVLKLEENNIKFIKGQSQQQQQQQQLQEQQLQEQQLQEQQLREQQLQEQQLQEQQLQEIRLKLKQYQLPTQLPTQQPTRQYQLEQYPKFLKFIEESEKRKNNFMVRSRP